MRIALGIEYNGHEFYGWQKQAGLCTLQESLEVALSKIADEAITVFCAGRTDAGVHATGQVVHFDTTALRDLRAWVMGANSYLPKAMCVRWAQIVDDAFHARFSAHSRRYHYVIFNSSTRPALLSSRVTWFYETIDVSRMQLAADYLIGEHDFTSYRSVQCESKTAMRNVQKIQVTRQGEFVLIQIQANAFLHHMVRNIVGVLYQIGIGNKEPDWAKTVLESKDRTVAAATAPPDGLYLVNVGYREPYVFPEALTHKFLY